jgi:transposase
VPRRLVSFIPIIIFVFFITNLVEGLDFKKNERKYKYTQGKPAYSRHMLTRLVIMASVDGIFSLRKIMKLAEENMVYMYLSGMDKPDFRTICRFKIECAEQIEEAFKMTVTVAAIISRFNQIPEIHKQEFFELIKIEFEKMNLKNDDIEYLDLYSKTNYVRIINSYTYREFELHKEKEILLNKLGKLVAQNKQLLNNNNKLKYDNDQFILENTNLKKHLYLKKNEMLEISNIIQSHNMY